MEWNGMYEQAYHLIFVPIKCVMCERILEEEGLFGNIRCYEFPMEMIPLDTDVLSMDMPHAFRECFLVRRTIRAQIDSIECHHQCRCS